MREAGSTSHTESAWNKPSAFDIRAPVGVSSASESTFVK